MYHKCLYNNNVGCCQVSVMEMSTCMYTYTFTARNNSNIMAVTVAETMPKSTTKNDKINFHKVVDATEKIQHREEEERCIRFFFIAVLTNYYKLGLKQYLLIVSQFWRYRSGWVWLTSFLVVSQGLSQSYLLGWPSFGGSEGASPSKLIQVFGRIQFLAHMER